MFSPRALLTNTQDHVYSESRCRGHPLITICWFIHFFEKQMLTTPGAVGSAVSPRHHLTYVPQIRATGLLAPQHIVQPFCRWFCRSEKSSHRPSSTTYPYGLCCTHTNFETTFRTDYAGHTDHTDHTDHTRIVVGTRPTRFKHTPGQACRREQPEQSSARSPRSSRRFPPYLFAPPYLAAPADPPVALT